MLADTNEPLLKLTFIDGSNGWVCGGNNIWHTSNGGRSWKLQLALPNNHVSSITMFDSLHGIGAGDIGVRTSNGGALWEIDPNIPPSIEMDFVDSLQGWAISIGKILHTADGGVSWTTQLDTNGVIWNDIFMLDEQNGWAVEGTFGRGVIVRTTNGGATWIYQTNPTGEVLGGVAFTDVQNGLAVGERGVILRTVDGGANWTNLKNSVTENHSESVYFLTETMGWLVAEGGTLLKTTNGGNSWVKLNTGPYTGFNDVYFVNESMGWIARTDGIIRTTNGGASWMDQPTPVSRRWSDIDFGHYPIGWMAGGGSDGKILKTVDGGVSWTDSTPGTLPGTLKRIQFPTIERGWIMCGSALSGSIQAVYRSTDGGGSWNLVLTGTADSTFSDISFVSDSIGWVSMFADAIFRTRDAGTSWEVLQTPDHFWSVFFVDSMNGWAGTGASGKIYATTDGGQKWVRQVTTITGPVYDMVFVDEGRGWAVGGWGAILHTTNGGTTFVEQAPPSPPLPQELTLYQNYPNPFNPSTTITFSVPTSGHVTLKIYDLLGREVLTLVDHPMFSGHHQVTLDANTLSSGVYFFRITAEESSRTKKLLLLR